MKTVRLNSKKIRADMNKRKEEWERKNKKRIKHSVRIERCRNDSEKKWVKRKVGEQKHWEVNNTKKRQNLIKKKRKCREILNYSNNSKNQKINI
jgi:hypothetical protein